MSAPTITLEEWELRRAALASNPRPRKQSAVPLTGGWIPSSTLPTLPEDTLIEVYLCGYLVTRRVGDLDSTTWKLSATKWRVLT